MQWKQKYTYFDKDAFFFIVPITSGDSISATTTCETYKVLSEFLKEAPKELELLQIANKRNEIALNAEQLLDIENYKLMLEMIRKEFGIHCDIDRLKASFTSKEVENVIEELYAIVMESDESYDTYLKSKNVVFSVNHERRDQYIGKRSKFCAELRNALKRPSFNELERMVYTKEFTADPKSSTYKNELLKFYYNIYQELGYPYWEEVKILLEDKISQGETKKANIIALLDKQISEVLKKDMFPCQITPLDAPSFKIFLDKVKESSLELSSDLSNESLEEKFLNFFEQVFSELGYGNWDAAKSLLESRIQAIIDMEDFSVDTPLESVALILEDHWDFMFQDEISQISIFYRTMSANGPHKKNVDKVSLLTQFFLAITNIYLKENKGYKANIGQDLERNYAEFIRQIVVGFENNQAIEDIIFDFLQQKLSIPMLSTAEKEAIKKDFNIKWQLIAGSQYFDEFFVRSESENSNIFEYCHNFSCEFSHFALNALKTKKQTYQTVQYLESFFNKKNKEFKKIPKADIAFNPNNFFYYLGTEADLEQELELCLRTRSFPNHLALYKLSIPDNITTGYELKESIAKRFKISYIDNIDIENLDSYPEAVQLKVLQDKSNITKLKKVTINLKSSGFKLEELIEKFDLKDLRFAGFSTSDFLQVGVSFLDMALAEYKELSSIFDGCSNKATNLAYEILANLDNDIEHIFSAPRVQGYSGFEFYKELKFSTSNLRDMGYSLVDLWQQKYSRESILLAGYPKDIVNHIFDSYTGADSKELVVTSLKARGFSLIDFKAAGFSAKELKDILNINDVCKLLRSGYKESDLKKAGFSSMYIGWTKFVGFCRGKEYEFQIQAIPGECSLTKVDSPHSGVCETGENPRDLKKHY